MSLLKEALIRIFSREIHPSQIKPQDINAPPRTIELDSEGKTVIIREKTGRVKTIGLLSGRQLGVSETGNTAAFIGRIKPGIEGDSLPGRLKRSPHFSHETGGRVYFLWGNILQEIAAGFFSHGVATHVLGVSVSLDGEYAAYLVEDRERETFGGKVIGDFFARRLFIERKGDFYGVVLETTPRTGTYGIAHSSGVYCPSWETIQTIIRRQGATFHPSSSELTVFRRI